MWYRKAKRTAADSGTSIRRFSAVRLVSAVIAEISHRVAETRRCTNIQRRGPACLGITPDNQFGRPRGLQICTVKQGFAADRAGNTGAASRASLGHHRRGQAAPGHAINRPISAPARRAGQRKPPDSFDARYRPTPNSGHHASPRQLSRFPDSKIRGLTPNGTYFRKFIPPSLLA
jgi:hypothetical protein